MFVVFKVQPQLQSVQSEVVPVAPTSQSVPVASAQVQCLSYCPLKNNATPTETGNALCY